MSSQKNFTVSPGVLRPSQLTTIFGPGSLVQMEYDSVIIMGIDTWSDLEKHYKKLNHPYLEAILDKDHFRMPWSPDQSRIISCRSFPSWGVCSNVKCRRLQRHKSAPLNGNRTFKCDDCRSDLYPARFVIMCDRGHLDEFPWIEWAHSKTSTKLCPNSNPKLRFRAYGTSPGLSDYYVICDECNASRNFGGATSSDVLKSIVPHCSGFMPWLDKTEQCVDIDDHPVSVYGVQTFSTSLYYPSTITALLIPKWLHPIQQIITENKSEIVAMLSIGSFKAIAEKSPIFKEVREKYSVVEIIGHLEKRFKLKEEFNKNSTELQIRKHEFEDLMNSEFQGNANLEISDSIVDNDIQKYVSNLKRIKRITEIRVIRAFTRGIAPDPYSPEIDNEVNFCSISKRKLNWYPAIENKGEGILFTLNEKELKKWESKQSVLSRCDATIEAFETWSLQRKWKQHDTLTARYLLLHTLAHIMIRELANLSGYNEASIRERIYCNKDYNGILLYTASPSSDGSLGGLVKQAEPDDFKQLLQSAIQRLEHCSRDPLCKEDDPVEKRHNNVPVHARLNGSACYGCVLLPETSCENINRLLDRRLLFDKKFGFFASLLEDNSN